MPELYCPTKLINFLIFMAENTRGKQNFAINYKLRSYLETPVMHVIMSFVYKQMVTKVVA